MLYCQDIESLLKGHVDGQMVLATYNRDGRLSSATRRLLVDLVINKLIQEYNEYEHQCNLVLYIKLLINYIIKIITFMFKIL